MPLQPILRRCLVLLAVCTAMLFFSTCAKDRAIGPFRIALTFDDGPDSVYTARILDILKVKNVRATFFVTGHHARMYPAVIRRIQSEGHVIGNHTFTHLYLPGASIATLLDEVARTQHYINRFSGIPSYLFRAPYGFISAEQKQQLEMRGYRVVKWDIDPLDYNLQRTPTPNDIADRVLLLRKNNGIVLMHSADYMDLQSRENTVLALPRIIDELRDKYNYQFVTVDQVPDLQ